MPPSSPDPQPSGKAKLIATVGLSTAALLVATVAGFEGDRHDPYYDIVHVRTVCYGETNVRMQQYTEAQCQDMLASHLADYAKTVLERNPELRGHPDQLAAATSLEYNIGGSAYWRSTVAKRFTAHNWRGACDAFVAWDKAGGKVSPGLHRRRVSEREICLRGL